MTKTLILIVVVLGVFTVFSLLIPDSFTTTIDDAFIYFLSSLWNLNSVIHVSVVMSCLQILSNFVLAVCVFWIFHWVLRIVS